MGSGFQRRLIEGMALRNLKPIDLAERTGLSKSRISHYTSGRYEAKQEALYLIAKALDVNEAWLMGHDVPMEREVTEFELGIEVKVLEQIQRIYGKQAIDLLEGFSRLNREGKSKVIDYAVDLGKVESYVQK